LILNKLGSSRAPHAVRDNVVAQRRRPRRGEGHRPESSLPLRHKQTGPFLRGLFVYSVKGQGEKPHRVRQIGRIADLDAGFAGARRARVQGWTRVNPNAHGGAGAAGGGMPGATVRERPPSAPGKCNKAPLFDQERGSAMIGASSNPLPPGLSLQMQSCKTFPIVCAPGQ
jgi:hypothetical protein